MQPRPGHGLIMKNLALDGILSILAPELASEETVARPQPQWRALVIDKMAIFQMRNLRGSTHAHGERQG
jgi:hypothetical protein